MSSMPFFFPCEAPEAREFFERHRPPAEAWLTELEDVHDPFIASAAHAAFCLLSSFVFSERQPPYDWLSFDVSDFLFRDLAEGGTVGMDGPVATFFDHLIEALQRFTDAGAIEAALGARLVAEMEEAREDFERFYHPDSSDEELEAIERRRSTTPPMSIGA